MPPKAEKVYFIHPNLREPLSKIFQAVKEFDHALKMQEGKTQLDKEFDHTFSDFDSRAEAFYTTICNLWMDTSLTTQEAAKVVRRFVRIMLQQPIDGPS